MISYRQCNYEGVNKLMWVTTDVGAFGNENDGPLFDWISEKDFFMENVKKFDVVVQAGGNCGMYPRFYKNYFKTVYTFEPDELNFSCLDINCDGPGFFKFLGGLGAKREKLSLQRKSSRNVGTHTIVNTPGDIQMYRIDDLNLSDCDLIHLDIEGYEKNALIGAEQTIKKFKPVIITERSHGADFLKSLGYKTYLNLRMDTVFIHSEHKM
jgi:FkbM family methyltransferase